MEELVARHRKEQKDLQGRITQKKKNATKKTRKGVNDECERLEFEMKTRHEAEIAAINPQTTSDVDESEEVGSTGAMASNVTGGDQKTESDDAAQAGSKVKKPNRQKARLARRAAEQQAQIDAAAEEAANFPDQRAQEISAMQQEMKKRGLVQTQIQPDGHCMYSACALTLPTKNKKTFKSVRATTADFISSHATDFAPFLEEPIDTYVSKIRDTAEWGGHLELQAIAKAFSVNINVLQSSGHVEQIQPETKASQDIWLAYYRHSFGLGEHYNALRKVQEG